MSWSSNTTQPPRERPFEEQVRTEVADLCKQKEPKFLSPTIGPDERSKTYPAHRLVRLCVARLATRSLAGARVQVALAVAATFLAAVWTPSGFITKTLSALATAVLGLLAINGWMKTRGIRSIYISQLFWHRFRQREDFSTRELSRLCHVFNVTLWGNVIRNIVSQLVSLATATYLFHIVGWVVALVSLIGVWFAQSSFLAAGHLLLAEAFDAVPEDIEATAIEWEQEGLLPGDRTRRSSVFRNLKTGRKLRIPNMRGSFLLAFGGFFGPVFAIIIFFLPVTWFALQSWLVYTPVATLSAIFGVWVAGKTVRIAKNGDSRQFRSLLLRPFLVQQSSVARKAITPVMGSVGGGGTIVDDNFEDTKVTWSIYMLPMDVITGADCIVPYRRQSAWQADVARLIEEADAAIIDVTELSENIEWEIDMTLWLMPIQRVILLAENGNFERLIAFASEKPGREIVLRATQIGYGTSYRDQLKLRWNLLRAFKGMR